MDSAARASRRLGALHGALVLALLAGCASGPPGSAPYPAGRDGAEAHPPTHLDEVPDAVPKLEPVRPGGPNKPYEVLGQHYVPLTGDPPFTERGLASWYGKKFQGHQTASGELYNMYAMTAAHRTLPIPSYVRVRNPANGREVIVRVNDRGPFHSGRIIDLSYTAALKLDLLKGVAPVEIERITYDEIRAGSWRQPGGGADGTRLAHADTDAGRPAAAARAGNQEGDATGAVARATPAVRGPSRGMRRRVPAAGTDSGAIAGTARAIGGAATTGVASSAATAASVTAGAARVLDVPPAATAADPDIAPRGGDVDAADARDATDVGHAAIEAASVGSGTPASAPTAGADAPEPASAGAGAPPASDDALAAAASASASAPPIASAPTPARAYTAAARGFWIQLGAFREAAGALDFQRRVQTDLDWLAPLLAIFDDHHLHRLQAGPYASRSDATSAAERIRSALQLVPVIVERR